MKKLSPPCRKEVPLSEKNRALIEPLLKNLPERTAQKGVQSVFEPGNCPECRGLGYRGRIGIYEAILMDRGIESIINENPSEREIWSAARKQGILTMQEDGVVKVLAGITSIEELLRVIDLSDLEEADDSAITKQSRYE